METEDGQVSLTDAELSTLVYLWWNAPALFSNEKLDDEYSPLVQKGYAYTKRECITPTRVSVRISQKGKNAVLAALKKNPARVVAACMREGLCYMAERLIQRLLREQLPELLACDEPGTQYAYVRLFAIERLEQLDSRGGTQPNTEGSDAMDREGRIVRLLSCDLKAPEDITDELLDNTLAWLWICERGMTSVVPEKCLYVITPCQGMYDFGLDDDVPSDRLVWTEHPDKSVSVVHDLLVLHGLGVRGEFVINVVGTLTIEKWKIMDHFVATHTHEVTFKEVPDQTWTLEEKRNGDD